MALNFGILQPVNIGGQIMAGEQEAQRNQLAQQQLKTGEMQREKAQMEMIGFNRRQAGLDEFLKLSAANGKTGTPEELADSFYNFSLTQGDPTLVMSAYNARQAAKERSAYQASRTPGALAAPAIAPAQELPGVTVGGPNPPTMLGAAPTANRLAPAPVAPAASANRLGVDTNALQTRVDELRSMYPNVPQAQKEADRLEKQLDESRKLFSVGGNLVTGAGDVRYKGPDKTNAPPVSIAEYERAKQDPEFMRFLQARDVAKTRVEVNAFTPASVEAQKQFVQTATEERKALRNAPDALKNIDAAKKLIPSASTFMGTGGEPFLAAASFLNNRLGFGISTQGVTDATVLRTRLFEGILDNLKRLDSQPSQEQQRVLGEALGNLGTDPAALGQILDRIGETVRDRVDRFNTDVTEAETRGVKFPFRPQITLPSLQPAPVNAAAQIPGRIRPAPVAGLPQGAIDKLLSGGGTDAEFDETFGAGAAAEVRKRAKGVK